MNVKLKSNFKNLLNTTTTNTTLSTIAKTKTSSTTLYNRIFKYAQFTIIFTVLFEKIEKSLSIYFDELFFLLTNIYLFSNEKVKVY